MEMTLASLHMCGIVLVLRDRLYISVMHCMALSPMCSRCLMFMLSSLFCVFDCICCLLWCDWNVITRAFCMSIYFRFDFMHYWLKRYLEFSLFVTVIFFPMPIVWLKVLEGFFLDSPAIVFQSVCCVRDPIGCQMILPELFFVFLNLFVYFSVEVC